MTPNTFIAILEGDPTRMSFGILKQYDTKADMIADVTPTYELNGITYEIEFGNTVTVIHDGTNNGLYRRIENGWEYAGTGVVGIGDGAIQAITVDQNANGESIGINVEDTDNGGVNFSLKLEPQTELTMDAGHIAIETNDFGQLFGRMTWKEIN